MKKFLAMAAVMTTVCGATAFTHINDVDDILVPTPYDMRVLETTEAAVTQTEQCIDILADEEDLKETEVYESTEALETTDHIWSWDSDEDTDGDDYIPGHRHVFDHNHVRETGIDDDGYPFDVINHYCRCGQYVTEDLIPIDFSYTCPDGEHDYEKDYINGEYYEYTCRKCGDWYEVHPEETEEMSEEEETTDDDE